MWTIVIFSALGALLIFGMGIANARDGYIRDIWPMFVVMLILGVVGGIVGLIFATILPAKTQTVTKSIDIVYIQDNASEEGAFFLGTGGTSSEMNYYFYYEESPGAYKMGRINRRKAKIVYTESDPRIEYSSLIPADHWWNNFSFCVKCYDDFESCQSRYTIYVPKGSIKRKFHLDAR